MKKRLPVIIIAIIVILVIAISVVIKNKESAAGKKIVIAVIPKGTSSFWHKVNMGAEDAAKEAGITIFWNGPNRESDRDEQIQIVKDFIAMKVSGIVLAPLDDKALVPVVEQTAEKNIPCVIIDSGIQTDKYVSFIATDNYKGGVMAAQRMGQILNGKGKVVVIKFAPGSASTTERENGFIDTIKKEFPNIIIADTKYGMDTPETALQATEDLLTKNPELDGLFACNNSTSIGALSALKSQGRAGKVKMIGFDSPQLLVDGLKEGIVDSFVVQNPYKMGYLGVKTVLARINGQQVERRIDTGINLITKENLDSPQAKMALE